MRTIVLAHPFASTQYSPYENGEKKRYISICVPGSVSFYCERIYSKKRHEQYFILQQRHSEEPFENTKHTPIHMRQKLKSSEVFCVLWHGKMSFMATSSTMTIAILQFNCRVIRWKVSRFFIVEFLQGTTYWVNKKLKFCDLTVFVIQNFTFT